MISAKKATRVATADEWANSWLEPKLICEVEYSVRTTKRMIRYAHLKRFGADLSDLDQTQTLHAAEKTMRSIWKGHIQISVVTLCVGIYSLNAPPAISNPNIATCW